MQCKQSLRNISKYFNEMYDVNFPLTEIEIKPKDLKMPWFSRELKKSSKTKQRLYIKF